MKNYFHVPKILGGQKSGVKIIGNLSTPWTCGTGAYDVVCCVVVVWYKLKR